MPRRVRNLSSLRAISARGAAMPGFGGSLRVVLLWLPARWPPLAGAHAAGPPVRALRRRDAHRSRRSACCRPRWRPPATIAAVSTAPGARKARARSTRYAAREFADAPLNVHAAALVLAFTEEVEANGWRLPPRPAPRPVARPAAPTLGPEQPEEGGRRWWSRSGSLTVLVHRFGPREPRAWHARRRRRERTAGGARRSCGATDLMLTGGELARRPQLSRPHPTGSTTSGRRSTSRADPTSAATLRLIAASIRPGPPLGLGPARRRAGSPASSPRRPRCWREPTTATRAALGGAVGGRAAPGARRRAARRHRHRHRLLRRRPARSSPPSTSSRGCAGVALADGTAARARGRRRRPRRRGARGAARRRAPGSRSRARRGLRLGAAAARRRLSLLQHRRHLAAPDRRQRQRAGGRRRRPRASSASPPRCSRATAAGR